MMSTMFNPLSPAASGESIVTGRVETKSLRRSPVKEARSPS
jgi:hypothetical protein